MNIRGLLNGTRWSWCWWGCKLSWVMWFDLRLWWNVYEKLAVFFVFIEGEKCQCADLYWVNFVCCLKIYQNIESLIYVQVNLLHQSDIYILVSSDFLVIDSCFYVATFPQHPNTTSNPDAARKAIFLFTSPSAISQKPNVTQWPCIDNQTHM